MELGAGMRAQGFVGRPSLHDDLLRGHETEVDSSIGTFLAEAAGGKATDGRQRILDIMPSGLHQRTPLVIGSAGDVDYINMVIAETEARG